MNKHTIQQELHTILKEEIPNDMNILPEIHKQLQKQSVTRIRPLMILSRVATVIAIFVLVSAGGYALFQRNLVSKDIPQQIITDINETQTIEDIAVTLNWAYADAHRIALAYSMEYQPTDTFINAPIVTLKTNDGTELPQDFGGGGGGGGSPNQPIVSETLINYDTSVIANSPDTVDLILTLDFSAEAILSNPNMAHMAGGGGGGGGGGGSSSSGGGGDGGGNTPLSTPDVSNIIDRVYTFSFTLPFYQALEVEPVEDTVESNGVNMTVNNIRYTPSLTKFDMCYTMPDEDMWGAQIQIITDSPDSPFYTRQMRPIETDANSEQQCFEVSASAAIPNDAEEFIIDVLFLAQPTRQLTEEVAKAEEEYFAELGYIIDIDATEHGFSFDILEFPEDTTEPEAMGYIHTNLFFKRYEGDWTFIVPLK